VTEPVPEESNEALDLTEAPPGQHDDDLPDEADKPQGPVDPSGPGGIDRQPPPGGPQRTDTPAGRAGEPGAAVQEENAGSSADQPSDDVG